MGWFKRRSEDSGLEARLRFERPAPRPEFLNAVAAQVSSRRPRTSLRLRVAFAAALTLAMLVAVASFGAVSYAAAGARQAAMSVSSVFLGSNASSAETTREGASTNQYVKPCKQAFKQQLKAENELHRANMATATTPAQRSAELRRHFTAVVRIFLEWVRCEGNQPSNGDAD